MRVYADLCDRKCFYCWNQFYASLRGSVRQEMLLLSWKRFYVSLRGSVRQEMLLYCWNQFDASLRGSVRQEIFPPKFEQECAEHFSKYSDDSSQCTAKASLEKGSSWPPEAIPYGVSHTRPLLATFWTTPTPWT